MSPALRVLLVLLFDFAVALVVNHVSTWTWISDLFEANQPLIVVILVVQFWLALGYQRQNESTPNPIETTPLYRPV